MRGLKRSGAASIGVAVLGLGAWIGGGAGDAAASSITLPISIELGPQKTGCFGTVEVDELGGGALRFTITLAGSHADLQEFYFNLAHHDDYGLELSDSVCNGGSCDSAFQLSEGTPTRGGAGARFDFSVNFGTGRGPKGNERLGSASFVVGAVGALTLADVLTETSSTGRGLDVILAVQTPGASRPATVGVLPIVVPELSTAALFSVGLAGIAFVGRRC